MLSWRTNDEKLLCLKCLGRRSRANSAGRHTTNAVPVSFQEIVSSVVGSSTMAYVFVRNGGVPAAGDAIRQESAVVQRRGKEGVRREQREEDASRKVDLGMRLGWT